MTATPTIHTFAAGEVATAANINLFGTAINFAFAPPILSIRQTAAQSIANGSSPGTALTYDTEDVDSSGMHSTVTNTSRATAVYPGWYEFGGGTGFASNATGARGGIGNVNGSPVNGTNTLTPANPASGVWVPYRMILIFLNVGDYFEWKATQTSGGALNTSATNTEQPTMVGMWRSN